jgi:hypothetical protein
MNVLRVRLGGFSLIEFTLGFHWFTLSSHWDTTPRPFRLISLQVYPFLDLSLLV